MSEWKKININDTSIEVLTDKAALVKMPNKSAYKDFKFWHPRKCLFAGRHRNAYALGYTDEFTFKLFKNGKGRFNAFDKIDEREITASEFETAFATTDANIRRTK